MQEKNHYAERVMSGDDAVSEYFKLKARLSLTSEEKENFRREVLPEYERYLKELTEQKKANEKLGTVVKQCRICGKFKKLSAFYKNPLKKFGRFDECKECIKERRQQNVDRKRKAGVKASVPA